jgi:hypothetical protein
MQLPRLPMIAKIAEIEKQELTAETRRRGGGRTSRTTGTEMQPQISQINAERKIMQSKGELFDPPLCR